MRSLATLTLVLATATLSATEPVIAIHGGAGTILRENMTEEREAEYREALEKALRTGWEILAEGGTSLDAVEAAIHVMEDSPLFNAGKGAVFTHEGRNELDASIMDGRTREAGSVAGVTVIRHPISGARAVMEKSPHVMMAGHGADLFATEQGLEIVDPKYFWTERRWKALQDRLRAEAEEYGDEFRNKSSAATETPVDEYFGTVGVVALDEHGNLAAGTSTGGMTNKRYGRVGDSPVIGAGTWADNATCAVSATGHGEYFIRWTIASTVAARMEFGGEDLETAATSTIDTLTSAGGTGGIIAIDREGNIAMPFNTAGMYRGSIDRKGKLTIAIYGE